MKNLKYVAFLLSIGLLGASPTMVYASDSGVAVTNEVKQPSVEVTTENNETNTPAEEVIKQPEVLPDKQETTSETTSSNEREPTASDEQETASPPQVVSGSSIELTVPSDLEVEKKEVALTSIPEDLHIDLPTAITLEKLENEQYGYNSTIKVYCDSDKEYRVELSLKDDVIEYVSSEGHTASGVATIGDSNGYSWSYEDVASGLEIPLSVLVDKPEYTGSYTTVLNFNLDIYEMQEVASEEDTSKPKDNEEVVDKDTKVEDKDVTDEATDKVDGADTEEVKDKDVTDEVGDETTEKVEDKDVATDEVIVEPSEDETPVDDSSLSGVVIKAEGLTNTTTVNISTGIVKALKGDKIVVDTDELTLDFKKKELRKI